MRSFFRQMRTYLYAGVFLLAASSGTRLFAQSATVSGQVIDSSGAVVKGATVSLLCTDTQIEQIVTSSANGSFILPPVKPGHYQVVVTAAGFEPWVDTEITLEIGEDKDVAAILHVGAVNQTVTVSDAPAELQTQNADRSTLLEQTFVQNLPLDPRNPLQLISATIGVTTNDANVTSGTNTTTQSTTNQFRINGAHLTTTDMLIDGGANMVAYNSQAAGIPGVDAIAEFRVLTSAIAPEYGYTSGGIVNMALKSGANKIHGGGWEYFRNDQMDANGYNANNAKQARPPLQRNQFGGQFGGPIIIPKLYHGRDKTFFFFSYEGLRDTYVPAGGFNALIPTDAMLGRNGYTIGDFSNADNSANYPAISTLYDPTNVVSGSRVAFTNNSIPTNRIDPVAKKLLSMFPSPTSGAFAASNHLYNYFSNATEGDTDNSIDLRLDHQLNAKQSFFGHFDRFSNYIKNPDVYGPTGLGHGQEPTNSDDRIPGYHIMVNHTWTIKNDLIFNHHVSWGHSESNRASVLPLSPSSQFGFSAAAAPGRTNTFTPQLGSVSGQLNCTMSGTTCSSYVIGNSEPVETNKSSVYQYQADLTWLKGKHTFKAGADIRRYFVQHWDPQDLTLTGGKALTAGPTPSSSATTGNAIAELLLGFTPVVSGYQPLVTIRDMVYFGYGEDIYRMTHKLTVTYGVRYGIIGSWVSDGNMLNYLDLTSSSPIAAAANLPNLVGGVGVPGLSEKARTEQHPSLFHIEPRFGVAYALDSKTVFHGSFGIFRHPQASEASYSEMAAFARVSTSVSTLTGGTTIAPGPSTSSPGYYTLADPFYAAGGGPATPYGPNPTPLAGNNVGSGPLSIMLGQNVSGDLRQQTGPYQEVLSLDVQRVLPSHFVVSAGYILNEGVRLRSGIALNQLSRTALATCQTGATFGGTFYAGDPSGVSCPALGVTGTINGTKVTGYTPANPFSKVITDTSAVNNLSSSTIQYGNLLRAYPQFGKFNALDVGWGHSTYNALQLSVQHRHANGLSILFGYTYSKEIDQTGDSSSSTTIQDNGCHSCERSVGEMDATHVLTENVVYELPFGHNRQFLKTGIAAYLAGGWQIGEAYKFNSGLPVLLTQTATSLVGSAVLRPTIVSGVSLAPTASTQAFNPAAFIKTPAYMFGNVPRYHPHIRYPDFQNIDVFLQKETKFMHDRVSATIRFELLNATNSVVFGPPDANATSATFGNKSTSQTNLAREGQISARVTF